jgi:hypothetical protein
MKKFFKNKFFLNLRNLFGIKPSYFNINNLDENKSISDAFFWRVDHNFSTIFRYTDLTKYFLNENSELTLVFFDNKNNFINKVNISNESMISGELNIGSYLLNNESSYGTFYVFHKINKKIDISIRQSCYTGYSFKKNLSSFVHGNTPVAYNNLHKPNAKNKYGLAGYNLFINKTYRVQNYLGDYHNVEIMLMNPCNKKISIETNSSKFNLNIGESKILEMNNLKKSIVLKSRCYLLRPIIFAYKNDFLDVFHG